MTDPDPKDREDARKGVGYGAPEETAAPGTAPGRRRLLFRVTTVLLATVAAFAAAEGILRIIGYEPERVFTKRALLSPLVEYHCYPGDPNKEFRRTPKIEGGEWKLVTYDVPPTELPLSRLSETPWCVEYRQSSQGYRDREYKAQPDKGILRIAGVGDSFTYGEGVQASRTLFKQMEASLGPGYEVINAGRSAANLSDEVQTVRELASSLGCRRAIVVFVVNDVWLTEELAKRQAYINDLINIRDERLAAHQRGAWWSGSLRVLELAGSTLAMRRITRDTIQWYRDSYDERLNGENIERLRDDFGALATLPKCRVAVAIYPLMEGLGDYPLEDVHDKVAALIREQGLPVLDLAPVFEDEDTEDLQVHPTDHHPNARAHGIAARAILAWLERDLPWFLMHE